MAERGFFSSCKANFRRNNGFIAREFAIAGQEKDRSGAAVRLPKKSNGFMPFKILKRRHFL